MLYFYELIQQTNKKEIITESIHHELEIIENKNNL